MPFPELLVRIVGRALLKCKWISGQLSVGESIQGVCFKDNLFPFIEKLATE
jgi:hypothetical protein